MFYVAKNGPCGVGNLHIVVLKNDSDPVSSNNIHKDSIYLRYPPTGKHLLIHLSTIC
jgi:hypothetical protein